MERRAIQETKKYYDTYGHLWTDRKTNSFYHEVQFRKIIRLWPARGTIIDIGCAHGIHVPLFLGIGRNLTYQGIDISSGFLRTAVKRYPQLTFTKANIADKKTLPRKKFDGFWAASTLMHIPLPLWHTMFDNIEALVKPGSFGYLTLPVGHPSGDKKIAEDNRHFTVLDEAAQRAFFKERNWLIKYAGSMDGFTTNDVWRWYIVQLPKKQ